MGLCTTELIPTLCFEVEANPSVKGSGIKWSCDLWFDVNLKNISLSTLLGLLCLLHLYAFHHSSLASKDSFSIKVQMSSQGMRERILIALFFVPSSSTAMHNALIVVEFISSSCFWMKVGSLLHWSFVVFFFFCIRIAWIMSGTYTLT